MSCIFQAGGKAFDIDRFLSTTKFTPYKSWRIGDPSWNGKTYDSSGFSLVASEADFSDIETQLEESAAFLDKHHDILAMLADFQGVEYAVLDFGVEFDSDSACCSIIFPPSLAKSAGLLGIGLEATFYRVKE